MKDFDTSSKYKSALESYGLGERLSDSVKGSFDYLKNSKVGRFIYRNEPDKRFSLYNPHHEGKAIKEIPTGIKGYLDGLRNYAHVATLNNDGSEPNSTSQKAKNFAKSPPGIFLILTAAGIAGSLIYRWLAGTPNVGYIVGKGSDIDSRIPSTPDHRAIRFNEPFFPCNGAEIGDNPNSAARTIILGTGDNSLSNVPKALATNLEPNTLAYAAPAIAGFGAGSICGISKYLIDKYAKKHA